MILIQEHVLLGKIAATVSPHIKIHRPLCLKLNFRTVFTCKQYLIFAYSSPDSDEITFLSEKAILWIQDSYFCQKQWLIIHISNVFFYYKHAAFYFTRLYLILTAPIHCRRSIGQQVIMLNLMKKQTHLHVMARE